jgi:hypothetical protein
MGGEHTEDSFDFLGLALLDERIKDDNVFALKKIGVSVGCIE